MDNLPTVIEPPQLLALAAALGWASGFRLYAAVFLTGIAGWMGWVDLPPGLHILQHPAVLGASGFMLFAEFFADKIPFVDSMWDAVHTVIRGRQRPGDSVAVIGPGVMGLLVAECARTLGAGRVIVIGRGRRLLRSMTLPAVRSAWGPSFETTSRRSEKIIPPGWRAPTRLRASPAPTRPSQKSSPKPCGTPPSPPDSTAITTACCT